MNPIMPRRRIEALKHMQARPGARVTCPVCGTGTLVLRPSQNVCSGTLPLALVSHFCDHEAVVPSETIPLTMRKSPP